MNTTAKMDVEVDVQLKWLNAGAVVEMPVVCHEKPNDER